MQTKVLLKNNSDPSDEEIRNALTPNLCRCTGYTKIIDSIKYAAKAIRENKTIPKPKSDGKVGSRHPKYGSTELTLGKALFVDDMKFDGMVFGSLKFSDHPRSIIKNINYSNVLNTQGVCKVLTAKDIPRL